MNAFARVDNTPEGLDITAHLPELRTALQEQRGFRIEQLAQLPAGDSAGPYDDPRDEVTEVVRAGAVLALRDIEAALHRLERGGYGRCERCAAAIPVERLEILPMVRFCMGCQREQEASG